MALMKCPACDGEILDKTPVCSHCGYPLEQAGVKESLGNRSPQSGNSQSESPEKLYKLILERVTQDGKYETIKIIRDASGCGLTDSKKMAEALPQTIALGLTYEDAQELKSRFEELGGAASIQEDSSSHSANDVVTKMVADEKALQNKKAAFLAGRPKCPACQSANIAKISAPKAGLFSGLLSLANGSVGKTMECKTCGHKW